MTGEWQRAFDDKSCHVAEHPLFPRLVAAASQSEQLRPGWIRRYGMGLTAGRWIYRDANGWGPGFGAVSLVPRRAIHLSKLIASDLECFDGWPAGEANGFVFGLARRYARERRSGRVAA